MTRVPQDSIEIAADTLLAHLMDTSEDWGFEGFDGKAAARVLARLMLEAVVDDGRMAVAG
jgi:hypothetical protein